jgi:hypothetical protein
MEKAARRAREHPAVLLAAGAIAISGVLLLHWFSRITFWRDEWVLLLHRRGWSVDTFLDPVGEHLSAAPILIYKLLLEVAGMSSPRPFQVVAVLFFLFSVALLFVYVRGRVGVWLALAGVLPILFLGPSWTDLLFPYQIGFFGSMACGLAALLCLDRRARGWDIAATVLLCAGLLFSDAGIPFVAGVAVEVGLGRDRLQRAYIVAVPAVLWIIWYIGWGHTAHTFVSLNNAANLPSYVPDGISTSLASWLGLNTTAVAGTDIAALDWGRPLLLLAAAIIAVRWYRLGRPTDRTLGTLTVLLGFWCLTGLNASIVSLPTATRYIYIGVVLVVLFASEVARDARVPVWATAAVVAVASAATVANFSVLRDAVPSLATIAQKERGGLAALALARDRVDPALVLDPQNSDVDYLGHQMDAGSYLSAVDAYGSPAYTPAELAGAPEVARVAADKVSGAALRIRLAPGTIARGQRCLKFSAASGPTARVPAAGLVIRPRAGEVQAALRRYARTSFPFPLGTLPSGQDQLLRIPPDRSTVPWIVQLTGSGRAQVCPAGRSRHAERRTPTGAKADGV